MLAAAFAWILLPRFSCALQQPDCSWLDNKGWRYVLFTSGSLTLVFFIFRFFLFKFYESPKFLLTRGLHKEALAVLEALAQQNQVILDITLENMPSKQHNKSSFKSMAEQVKPLFRPDLIRTTWTIWIIWICVAVGYNMFNCLLPKLLQNGDHFSLSIEDTCRNMFIMTACGIPGSVLATFVVETRFGRRGSMGLATLATGAGMLAFPLLDTSLAQLIANCLTSFFQNIMYGVLYAYTPEVFPTQVRGTGMGSASALNRIFGCIAPTLGGILLTTSATVPIYTSAAVILVAAVFMLSLPIETRGRRSC